MNEDDKRPKKWFNLEAPDHVVAEKDDSGHKMKKPDFAFSFEPDFAPHGAVPVKKSKTVQPTKEDVKEEPAKVNLAYDPLAIDGKTQGYDFLVKQEGELSSQNLEGGKISSLKLIKDGKTNVHYENNEWVSPPTTPAELQAVHDLKEKFNETPKKEFKSFKDQDPDKEPDIDR